MNEIDNLDERIKKLETSIVKLSEEVDEIVGVLVEMTNALAPIVVEWIENKKSEARERDNLLYR